jgi:histidyl-tRNA synthetase
MIYEHEIPTGSKLYFGESAKLKRKLENVASELFYDAGFEEIVTPFFSYHQHQSIDEKELLRFSDEQNHIVSLRAEYKTI